MGQTLSAPSLAAEADGWPAPALEDSTLPSHLPPYNTAILDTGNVSEDGTCTWHVQGGHLRFPIPPGFKASCEMFGQKIHLSVEPNSNFKLQTETGDVYEGATPTAPFAKWCLSLSRLEIPNGLEAFGFTNTQVQAILRQIAARTGKVDTLVAHLEPGTAVGAWARQDTTGTPATPTSGGVGTTANKSMSTPPLVEKIQREAQRIANTQRAPSLTPSLHNWLSVGAPEVTTKSPPRAPKRPATQPPLLPNLPSSEAITATPTLTPVASTPFSSFQAQYQQTGGLPPRPSSRAPSSFAPVPLAPEAHAAVLVKRPASRSRSGAMSSGRGWTAFTAFGLQTRDAIREANPYASATEVEKMVGRQWASLTAEGKQHYADVAAEVRRSSQGNLGAMGSGELRTEMNAAGFGAEQNFQHNQHQNAVLLLARTKSDAASAEERQLRPSRRPKIYGPEYDTSDAPLPGRKGSVWESEIDRVYTDILAMEESERVAAERAAAKAVKDAKAAQRKGAKKVKEAEVEADVLGVLADMRAEVLASESKESDGERTGGGDQLEEIDEGAASEKMMIKTAITHGQNGQEALSAHPAGEHHLVQEEQ
ncbi:hypothetical protein Ndes2526B_g04139 [Nannochloris sp. 'desiccata']|nr:hypothetical protein KSW81_001083 [Chlorella desiccata (nom. nud.)]KAH7620224.1 hypothetical protein NADE_002852 [Chlorella desiccata (nom. nud.)]